jgi:hypothetical protein
MPNVPYPYELCHSLSFENEKKNGTHYDLTLC